VAGLPIAIKAIVPARGAAIATLIGCHHVVTRCGQGGQLMSPTEGQLGETVQQQQQGFVVLCAVKTRFEYVHLQTCGDSDMA